MRTQPPDQNNPANPLFKVAALTLRTADSRVKRGRKVRVVASLNFKRSEDMRGVTKTTAGASITICFSLRIRRATFQITATFDGQSRNIAHIKNVAFMSPLEVKGRIMDRVSVSHSSGEGYDLSGSAHLGIEATNVSVGARAGAGGKMKSNKTTTAIGSKFRTFYRANISATYDDNAIHWEINPIRDPTMPASGPAFLLGEMFRIPSRTRAIDACSVNWNPEDQKGPLVISGSVYTLMEDLILENIRFEDELGNEVPWNKLDRETVAQNRIPIWSSLSGYATEKERIVKQIIRKHLLSQGMNIDGARVEICKAYA